MPIDSEAIAVLGDASRRALVEILAAGPCSVADLARRLPITRPAVSQHLKVLSEAGLVTHRTSGTRHLYQLDPQGVARLRTYLDDLWQAALFQFKAAAEQSQPTEEDDHEQR
jgi:DNA-binding transcriptional ArsR family regulator